MTDANRWLRERNVSGDTYDATYDRRAAAGENVHGEADFVQTFAPKSVLDAGCGTGRIAVAPTASVTTGQLRRL